MLSNYPNGFTQAHHDALFNGKPELTECATCRRECDPEYERMTELDGQAQCETCRQSCDGCDEWLTDETIATFGPIVHYRDYVMDGRLTAAHAQCAATAILTYFDGFFDYDHTTRDEIAAIVERSRKEETRRLPPLPAWWTPIRKEQVR